MSGIKTDDLAVVIIITAPFVVGAAMEFLPAWIAAPIVFVCGIFWICSAKFLREYKE